MSSKYDVMLRKMRGDDSGVAPFYATLALLQAVTGVEGDFAIVEDTDTLWLWDADTSAWAQVGGNSTDLGDIPASSGNWDSVFSTVQANSALWMLSGSEVDLGDIPASSGNWDSAYNTLGANSGLWNASSMSAPVGITSSVYQISMVDNGKLLTNAGMSGNCTINFPAKSTLGNAFSCQIVNEVGASATGGTITQDGNYKVHSFTTNGTLVVPGNKTVEVLVVAGGGAGGYNQGGGGGAGGLIHNTLIIPAGTYTVVVGTKGTGTGTTGNNGNNSSFYTFTAVGGGGGGGYPGGGPLNGANGGSGGGGPGSSTNSGGTGTTLQGFGGGAGAGGWGQGGGGGGAGGVGQTGAEGGGGGIGLQFSITGTPTYYAGGGQCVTNAGSHGLGTIGGGGASGGGNGVGADGADGIVIVRYYSASDSAVILAPANNTTDADQLPGVSALGNQLKSSSFGNTIQLRTTNNGIIATNGSPLYNGYLDTVP